MLVDKFWIKYLPLSLRLYVGANAKIFNLTVFQDDPASGKLEGQLRSSDGS